MEGEEESLQSCNDLSAACVDFEGVRHKSVTLPQNDLHVLRIGSSNAKSLQYQREESARVPVVL